MRLKIRKWAKNCVQPALDCLHCSHAIKKYWQGNPQTWTPKQPLPMPPGGEPIQHACNPGYAHCMACCTLTRFVGSGCAEVAQEAEDIRYHSNLAKTKQRHSECKFGIIVALIRPGISCHQACSTKYNNWVSGDKFQENPLCMSLDRLWRQIPFQPWLGFPGLVDCNYIR